VYADTLDQGREYYKIVKDLIPEYWPIILKRGCTEMERIQPSNTWDTISPESLELEQRLNDIFDFSEIYFDQGEWLKLEIKERWIKHAIKIGDPTAKEVAEKYSKDPEIWKKLVVHSVTYHEEAKG